MSMKSLAATLCLGAAALMMTGCGSDGGTAAPPPTEAAKASGEQGSAQSFTLATQGSNMSVYVGEAQGFFKDHGVDVEVVTIAQPQAQVAALDGGQVDAAQVAPNVAIAQNETRSGDKRLGFFETVGNASYALTAGPDSDLPSSTEVGFEAAVQALKGKTIGIPAAGGIMDVILRQTLEAGGLDPDKDVKIVTAQYGAAALTALKRGLVDAYTFEWQLAAPMVDQGGKVLMDGITPGSTPADLRLNEIMNGVFLAPRSAIAKNPDGYARFQAAIADAKKFMEDPKNADALAKIASENFEMTPAAAALYVKNGVPNLTPLLSCDTLEVTTDQLTAFGVMKPPAPACDDVYVDVKQ